MPNSGPRSTAIERQRILRIGQRAQQHRQRRDLRRLAERAGAAHLDRDVQRFERVRVRRDAMRFFRVRIRKSL